MSIFKTLLTFSLLAWVSVALSACGLDPQKPAEASAGKSIPEIADEAMRSKGKLTPEQIDALIKANAACRPETHS